MLLAVLLNQKVPGIAFFRAVYYLPTVTAGWRWRWGIWIFNPRLGILNYSLKQIGIQGPPWIFSKTWVKPSLILLSMFSVGPIMIILLAGLQGVPKELYESAEIDGAGNWAKFRNVTLPMLSPVLFFVIIISVVSSFQNFTEIRVMTEGGPGESSNVLSGTYGRTPSFLQLGIAAAVAWIMFVVLMVLTGAHSGWAGAGFTTRLTSDDDAKTQRKRQLAQIDPGRRAIGYVLTFALLVPLGIAFILPFIVMVSTALKP